MKYIVYIATSPSNKKYVGITNNFKRRIKEHKSSKYPFGKAIRKYSVEKFSFEFIQCDNINQAYRIESELIGKDEVESDEFYNISCGGRRDIQLGYKNPMRNPEVIKKHKGCWTTSNNPMNDPKLKAKMLGSGKRLKKQISVDGVIYSGIRKAARILNTTRQALGYRLKSNSFPTSFYL